MSPRLGGCIEAERDLKLVFSCCSSCHEDYEKWNFDLCSVAAEQGHYEVCCAAANEYDREQKIKRAAPPQEEQRP